MSELGCADDGRRRGCKGVAGNGWGEEAAGDERAWLRGRLWTAWVRGSVRGRLWMAWVQGSGWKWGGEKKPLEIGELGCAHGCGRRGLEVGREKKPLGMSELGCADGCGRQMGGEKMSLLEISELACEAGGN